MTAFNVLNRDEMVNRHLFLEASAGTGKTFAIENIVVRLIIGSKQTDPLLIENILVVTFTKMAAAELKERIHDNLERCLHLLKNASVEEDVEIQLPDYLLAQVEQGYEAINQARKRIEQALFSFDQAQIFTIHGFCWRMLKNYSMEAEISLDAGSYEDQSASKTQLLQVVRDFLQSGLHSSAYSSYQLKAIMLKANRDEEKLQKDLLQEISRGVDIEVYPTFGESLEQFQNAMTNLIREYGLVGTKILEDWLSLTPSYNGLCDNTKKIKQENLEKFERFSALFDQTEWNTSDLDGLLENDLQPWEIFIPENLKKTAKPSQNSLHYPNLLMALKDHLDSIISQTGNKTKIFARLARDCQLFMRGYQEQEEIFNHGDLLLQMRKAIDKSAFAKCVRNNYSAVIVDEFQDTDPVQWEIFSILFASKNQWNGSLNLIGDPKQSIYAFRQADIYTYLRAAEKLGSDSLMTLNTNFRSQPSLIDALNTLFDGTFDLFSLPKTSEILPYRKVLAGRKNASGLHEGASLQFWEVRNEGTLKNQVETDLILPAIAQEILHLHETKGVQFGQFAVLVADRYQEKRVFDYLRTLDIPVKSQKGMNLSNSSAVNEMRDLLNGIVHCHSKSSLGIALANRLIGLTHDEIALLTDENALFPIVEKFNQLQKTLNQYGFAAFYRDFMNSAWHAGGKSVIERLLEESEGSKFYREWQDLADLMISEEHLRHLLPHGIIAFLDELDEMAINEDERTNVYVDQHEEGVSILTTHLSKGLEFDFVFALGLITRPPSSEGKLILFDLQNQSVLGAVNNQDDPRYLKFCEEIDAEKMRQLYVALTRAKEKLYVPVVIEKNKKTVSYGCASPMELFLARLNNTSTDYPGLYQRLSNEDGSTLSTFAAKFPDVIGLTNLDFHKEIKPVRKKTDSSSLIMPKEIEIPGCPCVIQSFTSLSQGKIMNHDQWDEGLAVPHDFARIEKTEHSLPSGNETGVLLHKIFELLPFDVARMVNRPDELIPHIAPFLHGSSYVGWEEVIAKMIFNTLRTNFDKSGFCLGDVDPKKIYRETEFLYPCDLAQPMLQRLQAKPGFLKGIVDLFFEHQGKFYLVDWKTNWLGPSLEYYNQQNMEEAMVASDYHLQAKIYCEAFKRYLKLFNCGSLDECFGGIFYLFVRGISPSTGILRVPHEALGF